MNQTTTSSGTSAYQCIQNAAIQAYKSYDELTKNNVPVNLLIDSTISNDACCQPETHTVRISPRLACRSMSPKLCHDMYHEMAHIADKSHQKIACFKNKALQIVSTYLWKTLAQKSGLSATWLKVFIASDALLMASESIYARKFGALFASRWAELRADKLTVEHLIKDRHYEVVLYILMNNLSRVLRYERFNAAMPTYQQLFNNELRYVVQQGYSLALDTPDKQEQKEYDGVKTVGLLINKKTDQTAAISYYCEHNLFELVRKNPQIIYSKSL